MEVSPFDVKAARDSPRLDSPYFGESFAYEPHRRERRRGGYGRVRYQKRIYPGPTSAKLSQLCLRYGSKSRRGLQEKRESGKCSNKASLLDSDYDSGSMFGD